jgi:hypothetical protein
VKARQGKAWKDKARQDKERKGKPRQDKTRHGKARHSFLTIKMNLKYKNTITTVK